jgi:ADP-ribose pyrophosphatase YjhB (NUDIX family)
MQQNLTLERSMNDDHEVPIWVHWAREIYQIGQAGLFYSQNEFDRLRFQRLVDISAEIFSKYSDQPASAILAALTAQPGYVTPKVDVRAAVFQNEKILMVKEFTDNLWSLPGGYADVNESPSDMVEREVREETGLKVKARKVVGVYEGNHDREPLNVFHSYKVLFLCDYLEGSLQTSLETLDVRYYDLDELPQLSIYRTQERYIREAYLHLKDPGKPTVFD